MQLSSVVIDDPVPHLKRCRCGRNPQATYGPTSIVSCVGCPEKTAVETAPFFRDPISQHEHEAWRATLAWNERPAAGAARRPL